MSDLFSGLSNTYGFKFRPAPEGDKVRSIESIDTKKDSRIEYGLWHEGYRYAFVQLRLDCAIRCYYNSGYSAITE